MQRRCHLRLEDANAVCSLAYAEMYFGLAMLFRRFDLELFETTVEDVVPQHDFFVSWQKLDSVGVRVKVDKELP